MKKLVLAALFSTAALTAYANETKGDKFEKADTSKDGSLDKAEAKAVKVDEAAFTKADTNSDGKLSKEEFEKAAHSHK